MPLCWVSRPVVKRISSELFLVERWSDYWGSGSTSNRNNTSPSSSVSLITDHCLQSFLLLPSIKHHPLSPPSTCYHPVPHHLLSPAITSNHPCPPLSPIYIDPLTSLPSALNTLITIFTYTIGFIDHTITDHRPSLPQGLGTFATHRDESSRDLSMRSEGPDGTALTKVVVLLGPSSFRLISSLTTMMYEEH